MSNTPDRASESKPVTVPSLQKMKLQKRRITMVTAYDSTFARMLDQAGVDVLLVGDSLGMVVQGNDSTLSVTVDEMIYHCRAVSRGSRHAHVVGDMPFMSWQPTQAQALRNAGRFLSEGNAHAVKIEGGVDAAPTIERLVTAGIPVMGHVGLMPQRVHVMGGFRVQGRTPEDAARLLQDAAAVADAGAYALVLEGVPSDLAKEITHRVAIPTIGIGAGPDCDGQVLVCYDLLGLTPDLKPRFVKRYAEMFEQGVAAVEAYCQQVRSGQFPAPEHGFGHVGAAGKQHRATTNVTQLRDGKRGYGPDT